MWLSRLRHGEISWRGLLVVRRMHCGDTQKQQTKKKESGKSQRHILIKMKEDQALKQLMDKVQQTLGNYNSFYSFYHYNRLQLALLGIVLGLMYFGYTVYNNVETFQSPVTGKKYLLLITKAKQDRIAKTLSKSYLKQFRGKSTVENDVLSKKVWQLWNELEPPLEPHKTDSELVYNIEIFNDRNKVIMVLPCHQIFVSDAALEAYKTDRIKTVVKVLEAYIHLRIPARNLPYFSMAGTLLGSDDGEFSLHQQVKFRDIYGKLSIHPDQLAECVEYILKKDPSTSKNDILAHLKEVYLGAQYDQSSTSIKHTLAPLVQKQAAEQAKLID